MPAQTEPALQACGLHRFYHIGDEETAALRDVGFALPPGEFVAVMGPSGSGKSTLIACLTGLDEPDAGFVEVGGVRMSRRPESERARLRAKSFGILMQSGNLFTHLTVRENMALQMNLAGLRQDREERMAALLGTVGIAERGDAYPGELSGGEAARAGLAVALSADPPILIADEPTAEVDRLTESRILTVLDERRRRGRATLVATHSEPLAARADRIIRLRDGRIDDV
ncbi:MAG: ABC transporter ATP-binding protein [Pararhizobium sp.]